MGGKNATETAWADEAGIANAAAILERGGLVAVPTETVFGLAARADNAEAVNAIYSAKGRPSFNPLIVHVRDAAMAQGIGHFNDAALELAKAAWPGPLTMVVPRKSEAVLAGAVTAGLPTVAIRVAAHPVMQALLAAVPFPLAAPSANRSGFISPTSAEHVLASLDGRIDLVLQSDDVCAQGVESTIVAFREDGRWEELRPGPIDLAAIIGASVGAGADTPADGTIEAPGQLASHYAPGKPVRLNARSAKEGEFMIGFGPVAGDANLSEAGLLSEAAANLYDCLHHAARGPQPRIAVAPVPDEGVGRAVNDRLRRAAA